MPKFYVYAIYTASKRLGEFEADTKEAAIAMAEESGDVFARICHQCSREIEIGDCQDLEAEEIQ